jgi:hypothetical protein
MDKHKAELYRKESDASIWGFVELLQEAEYFKI